MKLVLFTGTIPTKINIKNWQAPIIAGFACGICGMIFSEVLGLGTDVLISVITSQLLFGYLLALLVRKINS